jgi:predicted transcriptional regulator
MTSVKPEQINKYLKNEKLTIFLNEDLKVALAVTDKCISLGLFNLNEEYDYRTDLVSFSQRAIDWGEELFSHALKKSVRFQPEN